MRWSLILSHYNFLILYLLEKLNERANTLLRQEQNMSKDVFNERVQYCTTQMIQPEMLSKPVQAVLIAVRNVSETSVVQSQDIFNEITNLKQM